MTMGVELGVRGCLYPVDLYFQVYPPLSSQCWTSIVTAGCYGHVEANIFERGPKAWLSASTSAALTLGKSGFSSLSRTQCLWAWGGVGGCGWRWVWVLPSASLFWLKFCDLGKLERPQWVLVERQERGGGVDHKPSQPVSLREQGL